MLALKRQALTCKVKREAQKASRFLLRTILGMSTMDKKKKDRLDKICAAINKTKSESIQHMGGHELEVERFPSGHPKLDSALGGGWPIGRFIELYGTESGGKTTTCLHAIAEFQKRFPSDVVAMIDSEFSFDPVYARALGVKTEELLVSQPDSAEDAMGILRDLISLGAKLVIVDSIAAMCPQAELNGEIGDSHVATLARVMTSSMKILTGSAAKAGTTVFWTNQMRENIGVTYGAKTKTPGGRAIKHHMSVRVQITKVGVEKDGDDVVSSKTKISVEKNKTAPPFKVADVSIVYGYGFDLVAGVFDMALQKKVVKKSGAWFAYGETFKVQGRYSTLEMLREDKELFKELEDAVYAAESIKAADKPVESKPEAVDPKVKKIKKKAESPVVRKAVSEGDSVDVGVDDV